MPALKFIPPRVQLCDPRTGFISREWYLFLQGVFDRIGGANGESTTDLNTSMFEDAGIEELKAGVYRGAQDAAQVPPTPPDLPADDPLLALVLALRDQVAELTKELEALRQGTLI